MTEDAKDSSKTARPPIRESFAAVVPKEIHFHHTYEDVWVPSYLPPSGGREDGFADNVLGDQFAVNREAVSESSLVRSVEKVGFASLDDVGVWADALKRLGFRVLIEIPVVEEGDQNGWAWTEY